MRRILIMFLVLVLGCAQGDSVPQQTVTVFAAASTREALECAAAAFRQRTGHEVVLNFGPTSSLARQISLGAQADLFLSADEEWVATLAEKGLVGNRRTLLSNSLVVIAPADSQLELPNLAALARPSVQRLALAGVAVPAGHYARSALESVSVLKSVENRIVEGGDVRAALAYVARGEADAGIVYATDAAGNAKVRVVHVVADRLHPPIRYPLVLLQREHTTDVAREFYEFLGTAVALDCFRASGFGVAE
jgi:molybdate transport system substrate-binding protein